MIGVDLSEEMLQQAAQKARHAAQPIQFVCQDIARLQLPKPVALLTCACDGVNYLPDAEAVRAFFAASFRALRAGGTFIFDVSTEYKFTHILDHQLYFEDREDVSYFWRSTFSQKERRLKMELTFFVHQRGDQYLRFDEVHVQRCYSCRELCDWLAAAGFEKVQAFEDYSDAPPTETSRRITFCARKPA